MQKPSSKFRFRPITRVVTALVLAATAAYAAPAARAQDDFLEKLNKRAREVRSDRRSDLILIPLLAKMTPPPAEIQADLEAGPAWILIDPSVTARWAKMKAWAEAAPQQAALKGLGDAAKQFDRNDPGMGWGLPYGATSEAMEAVRADLHVDLGSEEPTIAEADPKYLVRMQWLEELAHVEATRLLAEGQPGEAINTLINITYIGRQLADRELSSEVREGCRMMITALGRVRDIAYQDFRGERKLDIATLRALIERFADGQFRIARIRFPMGDLYAIEQLIARAYGNGGAPDGARLGPMLARIATRQHPLKIFNESARWTEAAKSMGDRRSTEEILGQVYGDWTTRWTIDPFDPRMRATFEFEKFSRPRYPLVSLLSDLTEFFDTRQVINTEIVGTRAALGLLGYFYQQRAFARVLTSARPDWISAKEADPFNPDERDRDGVPPLRYMRPITDDDQKRPHAMTVVTGSGYNFRLTLDDSVWMLWSVGSNSENDFARFVQNTSKMVSRADYLIWPPIESLTRQHLKDIGALQ
ncbi:MAG: hypothetical protein HEQ23_08815 [Tepidisphaera sp.]